MPEYGGDRDDLRGRALSDALALTESRFDGLLVENFGDRGLADAVVVSGPATSEAADDATVRAVLDAHDDAVRDVPVLAGSGVTAENVAELLDILDGAIIGTAVKEGGKTTNPVDENRAAALVAAARE